MSSVAMRQMRACIEACKQRLACVEKQREVPSGIPEYLAALESSINDTSPELLTSSISLIGKVFMALGLSADESCAELNRILQRELRR